MWYGNTNGGVACFYGGQTQINLYSENRKDLVTVGKRVFSAIGTEYVR